MDLDKMHENKYSTDVNEIPGTTEAVIEEYQLCKLIKDRLKDAEPFHKELKDLAENNRKYYKGAQEDASKVYEGETEIVVNRILSTLETIIPIITEKTPEPDVTITPTKRSNTILQEKLEKKLHDLWSRELRMQQKLERGIRNLAVSRFMCFKAFYNVEKEEVDVTIIPTSKIVFPKGIATREELPWIAEYIELPVSEIIRRYIREDKEKEQKFKDAIKYDGEKVGDDSLIRIVEYWQKDFVAWYYKEMILDFEANPNFNWSDEENEEAFVYNHHKNPSIPYFFANVYNFGDSLVDDTSMVELMKTLQDSINRRKRQIELNAEMANGKYVIAGKRISKADAAAIADNPREKIYLPDQDSVAGAIDILTGRAYDAGIYNDMADSKMEIDNVIGAHGTLRGERGSYETAAGRQILKTSDISRQRTLVRALEGLARELYDYMIQLMFVHYSQKRPFYVKPMEKAERLSPREAMEFIDREEFKEVNIQVEVIDGSIVPRDKDEQKAEALSLAQQKMMSLLDMYRILEYPDPEKLARNAMIEQIDPLMLFKEIEKGDQIDYEAIKNLMLIQANNTGVPLDIVYNVEDLELMTKYLLTLTDYVKGDEVNSELMPFSSLPFNAQIEVIEHLQRQKGLTDQLAAMQGATQPATMEQQAPQGIPAPQMQAPMPPAEQPPMI